MQDSVIISSSKIPEAECIKVSARRYSDDPKDIIERIFKNIKKNYRSIKDDLDCLFNKIREDLIRDLENEKLRSPILFRNYIKSIDFRLWAAADLIESIPGKLKNKQGTKDEVYMDMQIIPRYTSNLEKLINESVNEIIYRIVDETYVEK